MNSINLLPKNRKNVLAFERHAPKARLFLAIILISLLSVWGYALYQRKSIEKKTGELITESQQLSKAVAKYDKISTEAAELAKSINEFSGIVKNDRDWATMFNYIEKSLPPNVHIVTLNTSQDQGKYIVSISGLAENRRSVGVFRETLLYQTAEEERQQRVSDVVIDSINAVPGDSGGGQNFSLRATFDLTP